MIAPHRLIGSLLAGIRFRPTSRARGNGFVGTWTFEAPPANPAGGRGNLSRQICLLGGRVRRNNPWGARLDWTAPRRRALARGPAPPRSLCRSRSRDLEPCSDERAALRWPMLIFKSNLMVLPFSANGLHSTIDVSAAPLPTSLRRALLRNAYGSSRPSRCLSCISTISTPLLGVN